MTREDKIINIYIRDYRSGSKSRQGEGECFMEGRKTEVVRVVNGMYVEGERGKERANIEGGDIIEIF